MTDLRTELAERLGWKYEAFGWVHEEQKELGYLPSLSELVATGEHRLSEEQQLTYAHYFFEKYSTPSSDTDDMFRSIWNMLTASTEVRATALLSAL